MTYRKDIPGWLHSNEFLAIERLCNMVPSGKNILEIGPFAGRTTQIFASLCKSSTIYAIDPWPISDIPVVWEGINDYTGPEFNSNEVKSIFEAQILDVYPNVIGIQGRFPNDNLAIANLGLIHWDTDTVDTEENITIQIEAAWAMLESKGILSGHTFAGWMPNVVQAVRHFAIAKNVDIILPPSGSIWYIEKG